MFKARFLARNLCPKLIEHCVFFYGGSVEHQIWFLHVPGMDMLFLNMRLDAQWCTSCFFDWLSFIFGMVEVASWKLRYRPSQRHIKWDVVFGLDNGCGHEVHLSYPPTFFYQHVHIPCSYIRSKLSSKIHDSNTSRKQPNKCDPKTVPPWV